MHGSKGSGVAKVLAVLMLILMLPVAAYTQKPPDDVVKVMAGNSVVYAVDFKIEKVATGDPKVFGVVQTGDNEMIINAVAEGASNLIIFGPGDQRKEVFINVLTAELMLKAEELRGMLSDIEGVDVKIIGKKIIVDGLVFKSKDFGKINQLLASMPEVVNLVRMSPFMKKIVAQEIQRSIGRPGITVRVAKNAFLIEGVVPNDEEGQRAEKIALAYSPNVVNALLSTASQERPEPYAKPDIIEVNLTIMEVTKTALKQFGIYWNPTIDTNGQAGFDHQSEFTWFPFSTSMAENLVYSLAGTISSFFPTMQRINETGNGRSLMQQTLITKEGGAAKFFAGSEEPISIAQDGGTMSVEYKKVGMTLNVTPTLDELGNIDSLLEMESSTVTGTSGGAPIVNTNSVTTAINVPQGTTIVIGGLAGQRELKNLANSNPNDDGNNSLFEANYDRSRQKTQTEVVVFITPRIVAKVEDAGKDMKVNTKRSIKKVELDNLRSVFDEYYK